MVDPKRIKKTVVWRDIYLLAISFFWTILNVYFLPFYVWTVGIMRPWYILHGMLPYRDFVWLRMPLDLFLLSFWYRMFGATPLAYQLFIFIILCAITVVFYFVSKKILPKWYIVSFLFYELFLFPFFLNTEVGETLIALLMLLLVWAGYQYMEQSRIRWLIISGFVAGLALITKQNSVMAIFVLPAILVIGNLQKKGKLTHLVKNLMLYFLFALIPVLTLIVFYVINQGLKDFLYYTVLIVLGPYREFQPIAYGDGQKLFIGLLLTIIPSVIYWKETALKFKQIIFFALMMLSMYFSLLPSYLSYRVFTVFPLTALLAGTSIYLVFTTWRKSKILSIIFICCFLPFLFISTDFITAYFSFARDNGFAVRQYLKDYGIEEAKIAKWITENTKKDERIISYGSEMIYLLADRLPINKYIDLAPPLMQPYQKTAEIFLANPPSVVVFDEEHPDLKRGLDRWPFFDYMKTHYVEVMRFNSLVLYKLKN